MEQVKLSVLLGQPQDRRNAIMSVLETFRHWKPTLQPALPELLSQAQRATFWFHLRGVQTFHVSESSQIWYSIWDSFPRSLEWSFGRELDQLHTPRFKARSDHDFWEAFPASYRTLLQDSFFATLATPIDLELADRSTTAKRFQPLFNLWLAGNFPVGFDRRGFLMVLVA